MSTLTLIDAEAAARLMRKRSPSAVRVLVEALDELGEEDLEPPRVGISKNEARLELELKCDHARRNERVRRWTRRRLLVLLDELELLNDAEDRVQLRTMLLAHPRIALRCARDRGHKRLDFRLPLDELVQIAIDAGCEFQ